LTEDDTNLVLKIKNGNQNAFREFITQYQKFVLNVCFKFINNPDDANDIAQEVFIEVYRTIDKFRSESKISTWLYRIAVNRSLNFLRDNKKYKSTESYSEEPEKISGHTEESSTPDIVYRTGKKRYSF